MMLTRILVLSSLLLVLSAPAALAADGAPQPPRSDTPAAGGRHAAGDGAKLQQRLANLRTKLERAGAAFEKRCVSGKADTAKCTAAAKKLLTVVQRADGRIDTVIGKIKDRCDSGATERAVPKACARAQQIVQLLQDVQAKLRQFEQKLQEWLAHPPAGAPTDGGTANGSTDSSIESVDQLAADLAAVRDAAAESGL
jgi:hypothetical protein